MFSEKLPLEANDKWCWRAAILMSTYLFFSNEADSLCITLYQESFHIGFRGLKQALRCQGAKRGAFGSLGFPMSHQPLLHLFQSQACLCPAKLSSTPLPPSPQISVSLTIEANSIGKQTDSLCKETRIQSCFSETVLFCFFLTLAA